MTSENRLPVSQDYLNAANVVEGTAGQKSIVSY